MRIQLLGVIRGHMPLLPAVAQEWCLRKAYRWASGGPEARELAADCEERKSIVKRSSTLEPLQLVAVHILCTMDTPLHRSVTYYSSYLSISDIFFASASLGLNPTTGRLRGPRQGGWGGSYVLCGMLKAIAIAHRTALSV